MRADGAMSSDQYLVRTYTWLDSQGDVNIHAVRNAGPAGGRDAWADRRGPGAPIYFGYSDPNKLSGLPTDPDSVVVVEYYFPRP